MWLLPLGAVKPLQPLGVHCGVFSGKHAKGPITGFVVAVTVVGCAADLASERDTSGSDPMVCVGGLSEAVGVCWSVSALRPHPVLQRCLNSSSPIFTQRSGGGAWIGAWKARVRASCGMAWHGGCGAACHVSAVASGGSGSWLLLCDARGTTRDVSHCAVKAQ